MVSLPVSTQKPALDLFSCCCAIEIKGQYQEMDNTCCYLITAQKHFVYASSYTSDIFFLTACSPLRHLKYVSMSWLLSLLH